MMSPHISIRDSHSTGDLLLVVYRTGYHNRNIQRAVPGIYIGQPDGSSGQEFTTCALFRSDDGAEVLDHEWPGMVTNISNPYSGHPFSVSPDEIIHVESLMGAEALADVGKMAFSGRSEPREYSFRKGDILLASHETTYHQRYDPSNQFKLPTLSVGIVGEDCEGSPEGMHLWDAVDFYPDDRRPAVRNRLTRSNYLSYTHGRDVNGIEKLMTSDGLDELRESLRHHFELVGP